MSFLFMSAEVYQKNNSQIDRLRNPIALVQTFVTQPRNIRKIHLPF